MDLNNRQLKILHKLSWSDSYVSIKNLANLTDRAVRTIYADLNKINKCLLKSDQKTFIEIKRNHGAKLVGDLTKYRQLDIPDKESITEISREHRQVEIAIMLIIRREIVTYQKLSEMFFFSTTSIKRDLAAIQERYQVEIVSTRQGTLVEDRTEKIRQAMFKVTTDYLADHGCETLQDFENSGLELLENLYDVPLVKIAFENIFNIYYGSEFYLNEQYVQSAIIHVLVYIDRLLHGEHLTTRSNFLFEKIKFLDTYYLAASILDEVKKYKNAEISKEDVEGLSTLLLSHNIKCQSVNLENEKQLVLAVEQLIANMSDYLDVNFKNDYSLKERLLSHFLPMLYRLHSGVLINNPLLEDIKKQYGLMFEGVKFALSNIEAELNVVCNDAEISFLVVYFQIAYEKKITGKKILVVCPTGIGTSELIVNKVRSLLPYKDTLEITTIQQLYERDLSSVDFIISSVDVQNVDKPIVKISPLVDQNDKRNISKLYTEVFVEENHDDDDKEISFKQLPKLLDKKYIFLDKNFATKDDCLDFLISYVEEQGDVTNEFRDNVFQREELGKTSLDTGVAIPHAQPKSVVNSRVCILVLNEEIKWADNNVKLVVFLCISEKDRAYISALLTDIYQVVASKGKVTHFINYLKKEIGAMEK